VTASVEVKDIIDVLQRYKIAAQKVFRNKVHLVWDREAKEIKFEIPCTREFYSKQVAYYQLNYHALGLEDLLPHVYVLRLVDTWIEKLSPTQAEVLFWVYVNHDFEWDPKARRYRGLEIREVAERMNISREAVYKALRTGLRRILEFVETVAVS